MTLIIKVNMISLRGLTFVLILNKYEAFETKILRRVSHAP